MALFCVTIRGNSVSFLRFSFLRKYPRLSSAISPVCRLKYPYSCFSSDFCFQLFFYYYYSLIRVFHWTLSDSKSPQVSRTLLNILAVINNAVVWMVSTCPPTSKSSSPFSNPLVTVPNVPITIGIIVTCMFHSFFNSLARSRYLSFFSHSFSFILWSAGTAKTTILQVLFFFC